METFLVMQAIWDTFLILVSALGISVLIAIIATICFTEEQIETFLDKYGWF
ncbi:MAG: hypothetical protein GOVbin703_199 [Prokaryotic dsDNA virus sp.]|nr:MAG: hypothetical protein GOVbin703_199 [Prokaryotic dsDNA virus sp.]